MFHAEDYKEGGIAYAKRLNHHHYAEVESTRVHKAYYRDYYGNNNRYIRPVYKFFYGIPEDRVSEMVIWVKEENI